MSVGAIALLVMLVTAGLFALLGIIYTSKTTLNLENYMVSRNRLGSWMALATIVTSAWGRRVELRGLLAIAWVRRLRSRRLRNWDLGCGG
jgi:hypothetical protein